MKTRIDHLFRRRKYDYAQILSVLSLSLKGILDIKQLSEKLAEGVIKESTNKDLYKFNSEDDFKFFDKNGNYTYLPRKKRNYLPKRWQIIMQTGWKSIL